MIRRRLRTVRKDREFTQRQVAERIGVTRQFYGMIEAGLRNPTLELAQVIARVFGYSIEELFFADGGHEPCHDGSAGGARSA